MSAWTGELRINPMSLVWVTEKKEMLLPKTEIQGEMRMDGTEMMLPSECPGTLVWRSSIGSRSRYGLPKRNVDCSWI